MSKNNSKKKRKATALKKKKPDTLIIVLIGAVAVAVVFMIVSLIVMGVVKNPSNDSTVKETAEFVPPSLDNGAVQGTPDVPEERIKSYLPIYKEGMTFKAHICGEVIIENGSADVYFTNPAENKLLMKLRVFDSQNNVIAETGLIKPGEYLRSVSFDDIPQNGEDIIIKIMTYEPDTYYSGGAVPLKTKAIVK